ncbi:hypothetical protein ASF31_05610 [Brevundimonas sp. Leaf280]|nr:hypothetical protein ASF31_05610 [Brevundimonas sp. Leaf280]
MKNCEINLLAATTSVRFQFAKHPRNGQRGVMPARDDFARKRRFQTIGKETKKLHLKERL